jgi:hypothetical protein
MRVIFSQHALRRLAERAIPPTWVEIAVAGPDWGTPDPNDPALTRAYKSLPEADGRILRVTAFLDRDAVPPT